MAACCLVIIKKRLLAQIFTRVVDLVLVACQPPVLNMEVLEALRLGLAEALICISLQVAFSGHMSENLTGYSNSVLTNHSSQRRTSSVCHTALDEEFGSFSREHFVLKKKTKLAIKLVTKAVK